MVHSGGLSSGHYVAHVRHSGGAWAYASDSSVAPSTLGATLGVEAYLLFYERVSG